MNGILAYAKIGGKKQFLGTFDSIDEIRSEIDRHLEFHNKLSWTPFVYFLMNGEEYKLYMEDEK